MAAGKPKLKVLVMAEAAAAYNVEAYLLSLVLSENVAHTRVHALVTGAVTCRLKPGFHPSATHATNLRTYRTYATQGT